MTPNLVIAKLRYISTVRSKRIGTLCFRLVIDFEQNIV